MRKELNSQGIFLVHQHGRRFIVLEHQYGHRDVMWKRSIAGCLLKRRPTKGGSWAPQEPPSYTPVTVLLPAVCKCHTPNKLSYLYYRKRWEKSLENMHTDTRVLKRLNSWELLSLIKVMFKYKLSNIFVTSHFLLKENWNIHRVVKSSQVLMKITAYLVVTLLK